MRTIARRRQADPDAPHVVICGAGFGGLSAIDRLTRAGLRVTLVDGHLYSTFQPLLYQVATGGLNPGDVAYPAGGFAGRYGAIYRRGELAAIDTASRRVKLSNGRDLSYDYLILATGVSAAFYGVKGAAENTFGLYTRTDAIVLRDHVMAGFERLSVNPGDLSVTVVGGGATGVELAGTLAWLAWLALHLVYLLGGRNRVSTLINLTYRYVFWGHGGAVIVGDEPATPAAAPAEEASQPAAAPGPRSQLPAAAQPNEPVTPHPAHPPHLAFPASGAPSAPRTPRIRRTLCTPHHIPTDCSSLL